MLSAVSRSRPQPFLAPPFQVIHRPRDPRVVTLPLFGYRQVKNYSCGFASTLMVARHFRVPIAARELYERLGTSYWGTSQAAIVRALRGIGLRANLRYDVDFERVATAIDRGKVLIGYLEADEHWLVLYGYGRSPERVFVADPRPHYRRCERPWRLYGERLGGFGIVCSAGPSPRRAELSPVAASLAPRRACESLARIKAVVQPLDRRVAAGAERRRQTNAGDEGNARDTGHRDHRRGDAGRGESGAELA